MPLTAGFRQRPPPRVRAPQGGFFLRAESFISVASEIERLDDEPAFGPPIIGSYGGRSLHEQSRGESSFARSAKETRLSPP